MIITIHVTIADIQMNAKRILYYNISDNEAKQLRRARVDGKWRPIIHDLIRNTQNHLHPYLTCAPCMGNFPYHCDATTYGSASVLWLEPSTSLLDDSIIAHIFETPYCKECCPKVAQIAHNYTTEHKHALYSPMHL